jgi:putative tryptophan/tyrosine transport system permease protein
MSSQLQTLLTQPLLLGLIWSIFALGVFISFRILNIADMSVEGVFPFAAAVCLWMLKAGWNPIVSLLSAVAVGFACGCVTGVLNRYLKIDGLLAGIIVMTGLFSLTVAVTNGNISIKDTVPTVFTPFESFFSSFLGKSWGTFVGQLVLMALVVTGLYLATYWFFGTELGTAIRASGKNHQLSRAEGLNIDVLTILGLAISSSLIAIAGALYAMRATYATSNFGKGTLIVGLATLFLGEIALPKLSFKAHLASLVLGGYLYWLILSLIEMIPGYNPNYLYLIQAIFLTAVMVIPTFRKNISSFLQEKKRNHAGNQASE